MEVGAKVRVVNENGNVIAIGTYHGTGRPAKNLNAQYPRMDHYAVFIDGTMRYYPTGLNTLTPAAFNE